MVLAVGAGVKLESESESEYGAFITIISHTLRSWFLQGLDSLPSCIV